MDNTDKELAKKYLQVYNGYVSNNTNSDKELSKLYLRLYNDCMSYNNNHKNDLYTCEEFYEKFLRFTDKEKSNK